MSKVLVISGPTATGKTQLAFALAKKFNGELISADSRQVYKEMDIGTGKEFSTEIPTWGCDVVRPDQEWSAAHFVKLADKLIPEIQNRGKLPIIVGGTGLYISNLLNPPETLNIPPDKELRVELEKLSVTELQDRLGKINKKRFEEMNESDRQNPRRLVRAIEVFSVIPAILRQAQDGEHRRTKAGIYLNRFPIKSGMTSELWVKPGMTNVLHIALATSINIIDKRIEERVRQRIEKGAEEEVRKLVKKYGWDSALRFTIGYKEWRTDSHGRSKRPRNDSSGQGSLEEIIKLWTIHEKQYARRQLVWMAKYSPDKLFDIGDPNYYQDIEAYVGRWYYRKE